mgnify:FL=1
MKRMLVILFVLVSYIANSQSISITTNSGDEGFKIIENTTDTLYIQKLTYDTKDLLYATTPEIGVFLVDAFGKARSGAHPYDEWTIDGENCTR